MRTRPINFGRGEFLRAPDFITSHAPDRERRFLGHFCRGENPPSFVAASKDPTLSCRGVAGGEVRGSQELAPPDVIRKGFVGTMHHNEWLGFAESRQSRRCGAYFLVECLVYIALLAVIMSVAIKGFSRSFDNFRAVRRNSDDIIRVLHVGEQWRADIRAATNVVQLTHDADAEQLLIPSSNGVVIYRFSHGELHRQAAAPVNEQRLLSNVRSSQMESARRSQVTGWTWELELNPTRKDARVRPLFTFEAAAGSAN